MGNKITRTSFRLPDDTYQAFAILARQRRRSIGDAVLEAMHMWMDADAPPQRITPPAIATKTDGVIPNSPKLQRRLESILSGRNAVAERLMLAALEAAEELTHGRSLHDAEEHPDIKSVAEALAGAAGTQRENSGAHQPGTENRKSDTARDKKRLSR